jgi:hypothetical protein
MLVQILYSKRNPILQWHARDHIQSITALRQGAGFKHYTYSDGTSVLRLFRNSESADPRDKLWGFVGCFNGENDFYSPPDYERPLVDVYTEVAKAALESSECLYTLSEADRVSRVRSRIFLPGCQTGLTDSRAYP